MLSQPQETLELQHKQSKPIAVTCLAFPQGDVNNFIVGSEEGSVCTGEVLLSVPGIEPFALS
jgi:dynein intermediate chain